MSEFGKYYGARTEAPQEQTVTPTQKVNRGISALRPATETTVFAPEQTYLQFVEPDFSARNDTAAPLSSNNGIHSETRRALWRFRGKSGK